MTPHETHDTLSVLVQDKKGNLAGACTTSGWAYKMHGRVGDSPIIGAALFVDNEVGCAAATGLGGSYQIYWKFSCSRIDATRIQP